MVFQSEGIPDYPRSRYKTLLEGADEDNELFHYEWALAGLLTAVVVDSDAA